MDGTRVQKYWSNEMQAMLETYRQWSIFKRRPKSGVVGEYLFFDHNEEEVHLGFQFVLTGILSVYYDETRMG